MLPEQMNVMCKGSDTGAAPAATSDTEHLAEVVDRRHVLRGGD